MGFKFNPTTGNLDLISNPMVGENGTTGGTAGLVPAPTVLDTNKNKFLRADGTFSALTKYKSASPESINAVSAFTGRTTVANQHFGLAYSPELNLFVCICASGTNRIAISKDGENWYYFAAPQNSTWTKVTWSPQLGLFCAVSYDGASRCMTSPDGMVWTLRTIAAETWYDVCWSPQLSLFCAVSLSGGTGISTSPDGITWTSRSISGVTTNFYTVCWSPELNLFCTVRLNGSAYTSPDGITWTARTISNKSWARVCWSPGLGLFCAVGITGTNRCATSPDGITWTDRAIAAQSWRTVCWSDDLAMFIALSSGGHISYSFNGITWTTGTAPQSTNQWYDAVWSKQAGYFIIAGITGTNRLMTSKRVRLQEIGFEPDSKVLVITDATAARTFSALDAENTIKFTSAVAVVVTLPDDATTYFKIGTRIKCIQDGAGVVGFVAGGAAVLKSIGVLNQIGAQYGVVFAEKTAVNEWTLNGDIV